MHLRNVDEVAPARTAHGEIIYETVGHSAGGSSAHSLAQIVLPPGCASLRHYHPVAEETYHILSGTGIVEIGDERRMIQPGDSLWIPPGAVHRIANEGSVDLVFLAVCVPAWTPDNSIFLD